MKTAIVKIGNSRGIRIPKPLLEQCGLEGEVELEVRDEELVIRSTHKPRKNWDKAFEKMARQGDDVLLDEVSVSSWDDKEWEWK